LDTSDDKGADFRSIFQDGKRPKAKAKAKAKAENLELAVKA
jgi:hypothetical protein